MSDVLSILRFKPQINPDWRIVHELLLVRARAAKGELPAFRRGRMYFDFNTGKVRVVDRLAYRLDGSQAWQS